MNLHTASGSQENITNSIESLVGLYSLGTISKPISVSIENREITKCPYDKILWDGYFTGIDEEQRLEVENTMDFLFTKFNKLFPLVREGFGLSEEVFLAGIAKRLAYQIREAKQSGRKFTNGTVGSLKSISKDGNFTIEKIPYWAFGSSNVSLDFIKYQIPEGEKTLRDIMEHLGERGGDGEFFLPNSLGVSVMIQLVDGTIISQKRNNSIVLTQYAGLSSSASGAVSLLSEIKDGDTNMLQSNAIAEVNEELGLHPERLPYFPDLTGVVGSIQERLLHELNLDESSGIITPVGVVMERKRHNPEVVFTMVLRPGITLADIKKKWESADDKWESIDLVGKMPAEIEQDISYYKENMPENLHAHPTGLEEFIKTLPKDREWTGPHLIMSYFAWIKAIPENAQKYKNKVSGLLN